MTSPAAEFGGVEDFTVEPARLFAALTDLDAIASIIPDLVSHERVDAHTLKAVVRPGFGFLRGTLKLVIHVADLDPPKRATMQVSAQGIGTSMRIDSELQIEPLGIGSRLTWNARITESKGLLAAVSPALVRAAADQVIRHAWQQVHARVDP
jgi:carbon monoxide dehydrogenase subunit G